MKNFNLVQATSSAKNHKNYFAIALQQPNSSCQFSMPTVQDINQDINKAIRTGSAGLFISLLMAASMGCSPSPIRETERPPAVTPTSSNPSDATVSRPPRTNAKPIADVLTAEPTAVVDTTVQLRGRIVQQVPLVNGYIYELQDETGSIWVVADSASEALVIGNTIQVQGIVAYENIAIAGQEQGELYIQEQQIFD